MKNIQLLNKIAKVGTDKLDPAAYNIGTDVANPEGIMVRSANMLEMDFNPELLGIAPKPQEPTPEARTEAYYQKRPCAEMVASAVRIFLTHIDHK